MRFVDPYMSSIAGSFEVIAYNRENNTKKILVSDSNLVVSNARTLVRDYTFGESRPPTKMAFGDLNLTITSNLVDVPSPQLDDLTLTHQLYTKLFVTKQKIIQSERPAILYTAEILEDEFNGTGNQILAEAAILNDSDQMFARKTFSAIIKSASIRLAFNWTLLF